VIDAPSPQGRRHSIRKFPVEVPATKSTPCDKYGPYRIPTQVMLRASKAFGRNLVKELGTNDPVNLRYKRMLGGDPRPQRSALVDCFIKNTRTSDQLRRGRIEVWSCSLSVGVKGR